MIAAVVLGVAIMATFWWTYFGLAAGAQRRLEQVTGTDRALFYLDDVAYRSRDHRQVPIDRAAAGQAR